MAQVLLSDVSDYDDLNEKVGYRISEPYDEYFAPMRISKAQKEKRADLAKRLDDVFEGLLIYVYESQRAYSVLEGLDEINRMSGTTIVQISGLSAIYQSAIDTAREEYLEAIEDIFDPNGVLPLHAEETILATLTVLMRHSDEAYYYSRDRARAIAETESNYIYEYSELADAIEEGYQYKTWETIMDGRERDSHAELNGVTLPIEEPFEARGGLLAFPGDDSMGASDEELQNCRCSLSYSFTE